MKEQAIARYLSIQAETFALAQESANVLTKDQAAFALDGMVEVGEEFAALETCWYMIDDDELVVPSELVEKVRAFVDKYPPDPDSEFLDILDDAAARAAAAA